jgi:hypothetical protein
LTSFSASKARTVFRSAFEAGMSVHPLGLDHLAVLRRDGPVGVVRDVDRHVLEVPGLAEDVGLVVLDPEDGLVDAFLVELVLRQVCMSGPSESSSASSALMKTLPSQSLPMASGTDVSFSGVELAHMTLSTRPCCAAACRIFPPSGG